MPVALSAAEIPRYREFISEEPEHDPRRGPDDRPGQQHHEDLAPEKRCADQCYNQN